MTPVRYLPKVPKPVRDVIQTGPFGWCNSILIIKLVSDPRMKDVWDLVAPLSASDPELGEDLLHFCEDAYEWWDAMSKTPNHEIRKSLRKAAKHAEKLAAELKSSEGEILHFLGHGLRLEQLVLLSRLGGLTGTTQAGPSPKLEDFYQILPGRKSVQKSGRVLLPDLPSILEATACVLRFRAKKPVRSTRPTKLVPAGSTSPLDPFRTFLARELEGLFVARVGKKSHLQIAAILSTIGNTAVSASYVGKLVKR